MRLTPEKRSLIEKAYEKDKNLRMEDAFKIYSSKESAKQAVKSLESHGILKKKDIGKFELIKIPEELNYLEKESYGHRDYLGIILKRVMQRIHGEK